MKIGPKFKIARRLGSRVFTKCQTTKFVISGSPRTAKGAKGARGRRRSATLSGFGGRLIEKQKVRYSYGLKNRQLINYVRDVRSSPAGNPVVRLFEILESRLDNVVFRLGLAKSRLAARQIVSHGHVLVNGRKVNVPSYRTKSGDLIAIRPQSLQTALFRDLPERLKGTKIPGWLVFDEKVNEGRVTAKPVPGEVESDLNFGSLLEFYRK